MFHWLKTRRRQKLLATPLSPAWDGYLDQIAHVRLLAAEQRTKLRDLTRVFVAEKEWEGCRGVELTEEMQVMVAGLACLLLLGFEDFYFDNVYSILLYPEGFIAREQRGLGGEFYLEGESERIGEAHYRGAVILAWNEVQIDAEAVGQGSNLVVHEFAHQLDMLNGHVDGVPLLSRELQPRWEKIMKREFARLERQADRGRDTLIDPYGATDPAEFFAVVSECFFDLPAELRSERPELYELLRDYYRQDPASWKDEG